MILRSNSTSPYAYGYDTDLDWVQVLSTVVTTSLYEHEIPPNGLIDYSILAPSNEYTFILESTYDLNNLNNFSIGKVGQYFQFIYLTEN